MDWKDPGVNGFEKLESERLDRGSDGLEPEIAWEPLFNQKKFMLHNFSKFFFPKMFELQERHFVYFLTGRNRQVDMQPIFYSKP